MSAVLEELERHRVVPVVVVNEVVDASLIAEALATGGLPVAEVTLRTEPSYEALSEFAGRGDLLVGAGTVTSPEQVDRVAHLGARFVVSPGLDEAVIERSLELGLEVLPGVATASELQAALRWGLSAAKIFPARLLGGPAFIDALSAPFPTVRFMPSGGISLSDAPDYLRRQSVLAVGGSWMLDRALIQRRDTAALRDRVRSTVARAVAPGL